MSNAFDEFDPPAKGGNAFDEFDGPAKPAPKSGLIRRGIGDTALSFGQGAVGAVKAITDVTGAGTRVSKGLGDLSEGMQGLLSPERQAEMVARQAKVEEADASGSTFDQVTSRLGGFAEAPVQTLAQGIGSIVPTVAAAVATRGKTLPALAVGGAMGVGGVKGQNYDAVLNEALRQGKTQAEAEALAQQASEYSRQNAPQQALGGALGALAGTTGVERIVGGAVGAGQGIVKRVARGAIGEGLPEGAQGAQQQYAQNVALDNAGFPTDPMAGVAGQGVFEGTVGSAIGGVAGVPRPRGIDAPPVIPGQPVPTAPAVPAAPTPGDAIRATAPPVTGPLTGSLAAGIEAQAQAADAGLPPLPVAQVQELTGDEATSAVQQAQPNESRLQARRRAAQQARIDSGQGDDFEGALQAAQSAGGKGRMRAVNLPPTGEVSDVRVDSADTTDLEPMGVGEATEVDNIPTGDATDWEYVPTGQATELQPETIQADDILAQDGEPFASKTGAQAKAYASGGGRVVKIPDHFGSGVPGYVVRPVIAGRPNNTRGTDARDLPGARSAKPDGATLSALRKKWPGLKDKPDEYVIGAEAWEKARDRVRAAYEYRGTVESDIQDAYVEEVGQPWVAKNQLAFQRELTRRLNAEADRVQTLENTPGTMESARRDRRSEKSRKASADAMQKATADDIAFNVARVRELQRQGRLTPADAERLLELARGATDAFDAAMRLEDFVSDKQVAPSSAMPVGRDAEPANDAPRPNTLQARRAAAVSRETSAPPAPSPAEGVSAPKESPDGNQALRPEAEQAGQEPVRAEDAAPRSLKERREAAAKEREPFEHAGLKVYPGRVRVGDKIEDRWAVQLPENKATGKVLGDTLHATREEAMRAAEREVARFEREQRNRAEQDAADAARKSEEAARKASNRGKSLVERRADAILDRETSEDGQRMTRRQWVEQKVSEGLAPRITQEDKIKPLTRAQFNRADNEEQRAHERKVKAAGKKDVYWIGDYEVTKTEHDYAQEIKSADAAGNPTQAPPSQAPTPRESAAPAAAPAAVPRTGDGGGVEADGVAAEPERVKVMTRFGQNVYVNKADLDSDKPRMRHFTSTGKSLGIIVRENIDLTGEGRAADAKEQAENPLFNVIGTKDGRVFATEAAASRERSMRGLGDSHDIEPQGNGFVLKRKTAPASAQQVPPPAPAPTTDPFADDYSALVGKTIEQTVTTDDGKTAILRMDAARALRDFDRRERALADLKACLAGKG